MLKTLSQQLFLLFQYLVPQHLLSRMVGYCAFCTWQPFKNTMIKGFVRAFKVDLSIANRETAEEYEHFNDFFTRTLKPNARLIDPDGNAIVSPADGIISQVGQIHNSKLIQAKGIDYSIEQLLASSSTETQHYLNGSFATIYLSPKDYHRVHMPFDGKLTTMRHVPGKLFSVNLTTANHITNLFGRNERVICHFETRFGPMAMVMVGAMIVASIKTSWAGVITPIEKTGLRTWEYHLNTPQAPINLKKGAEAGQFLLGSTVILLFPENSIDWCDTLEANTPVLMGQKIGQINSQFLS